jgi:hypothetical protein
MTGIVDKSVRHKNIYVQGGWERGGWFETSQSDVWEAETKPDEDKIAMSGPSDVVQIQAASDDPQEKGDDEDDSRQTQEQHRIAAVQDRSNWAKTTLTLTANRMTFREPFKLFSFFWGLLIFLSCTSTLDMTRGV